MQLPCLAPYYTWEMSYLGEGEDILWYGTQLCPNPEEKQNSSTMAFIIYYRANIQAQE